MRVDEDLAAASATPLVLEILADGDSHGYAIVKRIRELSDGELEWADGMLYPLLHRLRRLGYVTAEWRLRLGRQRRYYGATDDGRAAGEAYRRQRVSVVRALGDVWRGCGGVLTALTGANRHRPVMLAVS